MAAGAEVNVYDATSVVRRLGPANKTYLATK